MPAENQPELVRAIPEFAISGQLVTVTGRFLANPDAAEPSQANPDVLATTSVFYNGVEVTPDRVDKISVTFPVPDSAVDGEVYVISDGMQTNSIAIFIDDDQDGLSNEQEILVGTDPAIADTDGVSDGDEVNIHATNPLLADTDGDGLTDGYEVDNGLDPNAASASFDADSDGLTNLEEFNLNASVNDPDTDNDELSDGDEVNIHGTDPLNADTDGGNDPDGFEVARNANPLDPTDDIRVFFDHVLIDAENFRWDITRDGRIREGTSNAYDFGLDIFINGEILDELSNTPFGISEDEDREILIGPQAIDNVLLSRKIYVPTDNNFARYLELIENPSASEVTIDVRIRSNLGSNSETVIIASSSGDTELGNDDTYIVTDDALDGSDSPALLHLWGNANSGLHPQESSLSGDRLSTNKYAQLAEEKKRCTIAIMI